jgi:hypothetical protein
VSLLRFRAPLPELVFNKYSVTSAGKYEEVGFELNTSVILGTAPQVKTAEGVGVGVSFGNH